MSIFTERIQWSFIFAEYKSCRRIPQQFLDYQGLDCLCAEDSELVSIGISSKWRKQLQNQYLHIWSWQLNLLESERMALRSVCTDRHLQASREHILRKFLKEEQKNSSLICAIHSSFLLLISPHPQLLTLKQFPLMKIF